MPAPKKTLNITDKMMAKLHAKGESLSRIAQAAGCTAATAKRRIEAVKAK